MALEAELEQEQERRPKVLVLLVDATLPSPVSRGLLQRKGQLRGEPFTRVPKERMMAASSLSGRMAVMVGVAAAASAGGLILAVAVEVLRQVVVMGRATCLGQVGQVGQVGG